MKAATATIATAAMMITTMIALLFMCIVLDYISNTNPR
jgi:hypothetical protein